MASLFSGKFKSLFFENRFLSLNFFISLLVNAFLWIWLYLRVEPQELPLPLHYNIYFGIDLIGEWYRIFLVPLSGSVIFFINFFISFIIYKREKVISLFLAGVSSMIQLLLLWGTFLMVSQLT